MSEFTIDAYEEFRPMGEVYEEIREHASEMLGRISTRMGFGEAATVPGQENDATNIVMAEEKKPDDVIVTEETRTKPDGTKVTVHTESLKPGSAGSGTGEGTPVPPIK